MQLLIYCSFRNGVICMQYGRRRGVAILLVIAMIFSLFPKLSARAETMPSLDGYVEGVVGWADMSQMDNPSLIDEYEYKGYVSEVGIKRLCPMFMGVSTEKPFDIDLSKFSIYFTQDPNGGTYNTLTDIG